MNQYFSCTVVLLQSLEGQKIVYLDILGSYKHSRFTARRREYKNIYNSPDAILFTRWYEERKRVVLLQFIGKLKKEYPTYVDLTPPEEPFLNSPTPLNRPWPFSVTI